MALYIFFQNRGDATAPTACPLKPSADIILSDANSHRIDRASNYTSFGPQICATLLKVAVHSEVAVFTSQFCSRSNPDPFPSVKKNYMCTEL